MKSLKQKILESIKNDEEMKNFYKSYYNYQKNVLNDNKFKDLNPEIEKFNDIDNQWMVHFVACDSGTFDDLIDMCKNGFKGHPFSAGFKGSQSRFEKRDATLNGFTYAHLITDLEDTYKKDKTSMSHGLITGNKALILVKDDGLRFMHFGDGNIQCIFRNKDISEVVLLCRIGKPGDYGNDYAYNMIKLSYKKNGEENKYGRYGIDGEPYEDKYGSTIYPKLGVSDELYSDKKGAYGIIDIINQALKIYEKDKKEYNWKQ